MSKLTLWVCCGGWVCAVKKVVPFPVRLIKPNFLSGGRPHRRRKTSGQSLSSDDQSSDYTTSDYSDSSEDSELLALVEGGCKKNPFTVPRIVVQPNSPTPGGKVAPAGPTKAVSPGVPDPSHVSQTVPMGPTPFGTALYQPSLSSLTKYQYKTPSLPSSSAAAPSNQYRTLSGVLSNNLKKNWATGPSASADRPQRNKVDQAEIDARLKSLMDRLSSQQSLLKPADKPSEQMQHIVDQGNKPQRKMSAPAEYKPYKPSILPSAASIRKLKEDREAAGEEAEVKVEENGVSIVVPGSVQVMAKDTEDSETADSESDSSESESLTTEVSECEHNKVEHTLPEIKINLADTEEPEVMPTVVSKLAETEEPEVIPTVPSKLAENEEPEVITTVLSKSKTASETKKCDKSFGDDLDFIDDDDDSLEEQSSSVKNNNQETCKTQVVKEEKKRSPAKRRPSLLKTVVSIKSDQPVTVVNYTESFNDTKSEGTTATHNTPQQTTGSSAEPLNASLASPEMEESFKTTEGDLDSSKDVFESFNNTMDESVSLADASLESAGELSTETDCLNSVVLGSSQEAVRMQESVTTGSEESDGSGQLIQAVMVDTGEDNHVEVALDNPEEVPAVEDECGNLLIVSENARPQYTGENETSTDGKEEEEATNEVPAEITDSLNDIYRMTNANEKIDRLANHQQHSSNMIHDLIIGRSKQRRVRQPRTTAPVSLVPSVPSGGSPPKEEVLQTPGRDKSLSRGLRESSLSR